MWRRAKVPKPVPMAVDKDHSQRNQPTNNTLTVVPNLPSRNTRHKGVNIPIALAAMVTNTATTRSFLDRSRCPNAQLQACEMVGASPLPCSLISDGVLCRAFVCAGWLGMCAGAWGGLLGACPDALWVVLCVGLGLHFWRLCSRALPAHYLAWVEGACAEGLLPSVGPHGAQALCPMCCVHCVLLLAW